MVKKLLCIHCTFTWLQKINNGQVQVKCPKCNQLIHIDKNRQ